MIRLTATCLVVLATLVGVPAAQGAEINPQEIGLVVDNFLVDVDATVVGLLNGAGGGSHGLTTFTNRSVYAGQPANAMVTEPISTRVEWEVWHSNTVAAIGSDTYEIDYKGFMKDTRVLASTDPTYDIRWESKWYKNNPLKSTTYAEGGGTFKYTDPDFEFDITVDPSDPANVSISGSAGVTLWGVVDLTIEGKKDFGAHLLTAEVKAATSVPLLSDVLGALDLESDAGSVAFVFEYHQDTGTYKSAIEAQAFYGLFEAQETVNGGSVRAPAIKLPPNNPVGPTDLQPPNTHTIDGKWVITPLGANLVFPAAGGSGATNFTDTLNPHGDLADEIALLQTENVFNFQQLYSHAGFIDPLSHALDSPIPSVAYSFQDPTISFPTTAGPPPGITLSPLEITGVPEPSTWALGLLGGWALLSMWFHIDKESKRVRFPRGRCDDDAVTGIGGSRK